MATERSARIARWTLTERLAHWLLAGSFLVLFVSGLALYLPSLASYVDRPTAKAWHLWSAAVLPLGLLALVVAGNRKSLAGTVREIDRLDADDRAWLRGGPRRLFTTAGAPPQGRLNAGQKLAAAIIAALMVVMAVTGLLLWHGEADTRYRFAGTVIVHDWGTVLLVCLVAGHLYLTLLSPLTRASLRGMTTGSVDREWAREHHAKWVAELEARDAVVTPDTTAAPRSATVPTAGHARR
jgi:formate dehydrogenase subunit gamma